MFIYNLVPKWLLVIIVGILLAVGLYTGIKMEYYKIENAKLTANNEILTNNQKAYESALSTCSQSLAAEKKNSERTEAIHTATQEHQNAINQIYVKEGANAKTDIKDAIVESNKLSDRFNTGDGVRIPDQSDSGRHGDWLFLAYASDPHPNPGHSSPGSVDSGPLVR